MVITVISEEERYGLACNKNCNLEAENKRRDLLKKSQISIFHKILIAVSILFLVPVFMVSTGIYVYIKRLNAYAIPDIFAFVLFIIAVTVCIAIKRSNKKSGIKSSRSIKVQMVLPFCLCFIYCFMFAAYGTLGGENVLLDKGADIFGSYIIVDSIAWEGGLNGREQKVYCSSDYYEKVEMNDKIVIYYEYNSIVNFGVLNE